MRKIKVVNLLHAFVITGNSLEIKFRLVKFETKICFNKTEKLVS